MGYPEGCPFGLFRQRHRLSQISQKNDQMVLSIKTLLRTHWHWKSIAYLIKIVFWQLYMLHKNDIVASNLYHTEIVKVYGLFQSIFTSVCRLNSAPASLWWKIKTELIYRKKVNFKSKSSGFKSVIFKSKISNRL